MAYSEGDLLRAFDEHHAALYRFAWRLAGPDAEDAVQEAFLGLVRPGCAFDAVRGNLRTYLFGAVRNQCLKRLRRREDAGEVERADGRTPEAELLRGEVADAVAAAIAALPESQREVLVLAHYEQLSLAEIADIVEVDVGAAKSRLQRARATLRETLAAYAPVEKKR